MSPLSEEIAPAFSPVPFADMLLSVIWISFPPRMTGLYGAVVDAVISTPVMRNAPTVLMANASASKTNVPLFWRVTVPSRSAWELRLLTPIAVPCLQSTCRLPVPLTVRAPLRVIPSLSEEILFSPSRTSSTTPDLTVIPFDRLALFRRMVHLSAPFRFS